MKNSYPPISLSAYSAIAIAMGTHVSLDAQVVYTDVDPDEHFITWNNDLFVIDFDENGINDVTISQHLWIIVSLFSSTSGWSTMGWVDQAISVIAYDVLNNVPGSVVEYAKGATPLMTGEIISFGSSWNDYGFARLWNGEGDYHNWVDEYGIGGDTDFDEIEGQWYNEEDKYLGVQFLIDGAVHFGWVQLTTDSTSKIYQNVYIKAYAYEATPGAPIYAGILPGCFPPSPIGASSITGTTAKLKWVAMDSVDHYELQYRQAGAIDWTTKTVAGIKSFRKVAGLNCDSNYEWRVRTICEDGELSVYSDVQTFATASCRTGEIPDQNEEAVTIFSTGKNIQIYFETKPEENMMCTVFDMLGNIVLTQPVNNEVNKISTSLPAGLYIVHVFYNNYSYANKVVIN